jgi:outer membrane autotransporter protein
LGAIAGSGGTGVLLAGASNALIMNGPTATLSGNAVGSGTDTFRLTGPGTNSFNVSQIAGGFTQFQKMGSSTWTLTGTGAPDQNWNISQGTLVGTTSSIQGSAIANQAALVFDQTFAGTYAGSISGPGSLEKRGSGTVVLTGASALSGPTTVDAGRLIVNGSLASSIVTVNGGVLGGTGTVGGFVANTGTVAPGNSISTLNVGGDLAFAGASTYEVEVNAAGQSDLIRAGGMGTLSGGTVQVLAENGAYRPRTTYTILTAAGGVFGRFGPVFTNLAFLSPELAYDPNNVYLTLTRNDLSFTGVAGSRNQSGVARAAESLGFGNPVFDALVLLSPEQARAAFDLLSGEIHASVQSVLMEDSRYPRQAILSRLRQEAYAGFPGPIGALGLDGPATYMADLPQRAATPAPQSIIRPAFTVWAQAVGAWGKFDGDRNAGKVERELGGLFGGVDAGLGEVWRVGLAAGYTRSDVSIGARLSSAEIDTGHVAAYAGARFGALSARFGGAFSFHDIDTHRSIVFPGFSDRTTAGYGAQTGQVFGELGYGVALGQLALEPFAGLAYVNVETDRFRERGEAAALVGGRNSFETGYSTLGLRLGTSYGLANGMALMPRLTAAWQHAFSDVHPTASLAFAGGSTPFSVRGVPIARDSLLVEAGLDLAVSARARVGLSYAGAVADRVEDHAVKANLAWNF